MAKKKTPGVPAAVTQAAKAEAELKYGPQIRAFKILADNATNQYLQSAHNARAGADIVAAAAEKSRTSLLPQLDAIGQPTPGAPPASSGPGSEGEMMARMLGRDRVSVLGRLADEGPRAQAGANFQIATARRSRDQSLDQIGQQAAGLTGEAGAYAASQISAMLADQAKQDFDAQQARLDRKNTFDISAADNVQSGANNAATNKVAEDRIAAAKEAAKEAKRLKDVAAHKKYSTSVTNLNKHYTGQINQALALLPKLSAQTTKVNARTGQPVSVDQYGRYPTVDDAGKPIRLIDAPPSVATVNAAIAKLAKINDPIIIYAARQLASPAKRVSAGTAGAIKRRFHVTLPPWMLGSASPQYATPQEPVPPHGGVS